MSVDLAVWYEPAGVTDERLDGAPIGLGFRVPCLVISPFSRGGVVNGGVFDHTSQLQLLARRFGVSMPNVSDWRRGAVGNLGAVLERKRGGASTPRLPSRAETAADAARAEAALRFEAHEQGGAKGSTR